MMKEYLKPKFDEKVSRHEFRGRVLPLPPVISENLSFIGE
jgi:hypothetical protein